MMRRMRRISGLTLLTALTLLLVQGAWAAACDPSMASNHAENPSGMSMPEMPSGHDCLPGHGESPSDTESGGSDCPFTIPGASQGCIASASLPSAAVAISAAAAVAPLPLPALAATPLLLRSAAIFHPPKA